MNAPLPVATLLCVYRGDEPARFTAAVQSLLDQEPDPELAFESRLYLGIDGPLPAALEGAVSALLPRLHRVYRAPVNQGLARTLNALLQHLGDERFVFRMDADDVALPQRYRLQLAYLRAHPEIDILGTAITEVDEASGSTRIVRFARGPADALARSHRRVPVAHPTVCVRRRVFDTVAGYPERGTNEDVALWFECMRHGMRFDNLDEPLLRYRISPAFWQRRGVRKAGSELMCYLRGIHALHGAFTWRYAFPLLRFGLRLMPAALSRLAYRSAWLRGGTTARGHARG